MSSKKPKKIRMDLLSVDSLKHLEAGQKVDHILDKVRQNHLVILDGRLPPNEELMLVQQTMGNVADDFSGIEVCTIERDINKYQEMLQKLLQSIIKKQPATASGLTFVGPSKIVKQIKRVKTQENAFQVLAEV